MSPPDSVAPDAARLIAFAARRLFGGKRRRSIVPLADAAMREGAWERAAELYAEALARAPGRAALWVQRGHALKELGRLDEAEAAYRRAAAAAPEDADPPLHLGHMLLARGARLAALAALRRAGALGDPGAAEVARDVAVALDVEDFAPWDGPSESPPEGPLAVAGAISLAAGTRVTGWAVDVRDPTRPLTLVLRDASGAQLAYAETAPGESPADPREAGAFALAVPEALLDGAERLLMVAAGRDGAAALGVSPFRFPLGGVAFADAARGAIAGWTESGAAVRIALDGGAPMEVAAETALRNLAMASARGFVLPLPTEALDGAEHVAEVTLAPTGTPLPGSPVKFALRPPKPRVEIHAIAGRRIQGALSALDGAATPTRLAVAFDGGEAVEIAAARPRVDGPGARAHADFVFEAPPGARLARIEALDGVAVGPLETIELDGELQPPHSRHWEEPAEDLSETAPPALYDTLCARVDMDEVARTGLAADAEEAERRVRETPIEADAPLVSIVMPTFNRAHTLDEAIQSVLDQRYRRWELLIGDDASADRTAEVARRFDDPRIRYFSFEKSNGARTRNKCLGFARGRVIAYLDSDNLWSPWFLSVMVRSLLAGGMAAFAGYVDITIERGHARLDEIRRPKFHPVRLHERNVVDLNGYVHHRAIYDWLGGFDPDLPRLQDWDLVLRHGAIFPPVSTPLALVLYRRNPSWGQVTQLYAGHDVRGAVMERTTRRLENGHPRLRLRAPRPAQIALLAAARPGSGVLAEGLSRLFGSMANSVIHSAPGFTARAESGSPARLWRDPEALARVIGRLEGADALISIALDPAAAPALARGAGVPVYALSSTEAGPALIRQDAEAAPIQLGALPLGADASDPPAESSESSIAALFAGRFGVGVDPTVVAARARQLAVAGILLVPPDPFGADWVAIAEDGQSTPLDPESGLAALRRRADVVVAPDGVGGLEPSAAALFLEAVGRAAVPIVPGSAFWTPFLEERAAIRLREAGAGWIIERIKALRADRSLAVLRRRAARGHQIAFHPELAQERLRALACLLALGRPELQL